MMKRRDLVDSLLAVVLGFGVPVALVTSTGWPVAQIPQAPHHFLAAAVLIAWVLWAWCTVGVAERVIRRVARRDLAVTASMGRIDRISIALASVVLSLSATLFSGSAPALAAPAVHADRAAATQIQKPPAPSSSTYVVQSGDCLWSIAAQLYGDGDAWTVLANANLGRVMGPGQVFVDPSLIYPGWSLQTPGLAPVASPPPSARAPQQAMSRVPSPHRPAPAPSSVSVNDAAVVIAPGIGAGILLFTLLRRRYRRAGAHDQPVADQLIDVAIGAARLGQVPLATMAERAVWLAHEDGVLSEALVLELSATGARLFRDGRACWNAPADELLRETVLLDVAPAAIFPLGDRDGASWAIVLPRSSAISLSGSHAEQFLDLTLGLQNEWAWGPLIATVSNNAELAEAELMVDDGALIIARGFDPDITAERASFVAVAASAPIEISETEIRIDALSLQIPRNHIGLNTSLEADAAEREGVLIASELPETIELTAASLESHPAVIVRLLRSEPTIEGGARAVESKRSRRATELLAYLSLHHHEPVTSDRLRSRVLGTSSTDAASKTLFNVASALRQALGTFNEEPIFPRASRTGLYKAGEFTTCDITLLEASVLAATQTADTNESMAHYRQALTFIESEPLATCLVGYEWFDAEGHRGRLETTVEQAALALAELALEHDHVALAAFALERAHFVVPYSEALAEMALEVAAAQLDPDGLRRAFSQLAQLVDELDPGRSPRENVEKRYLELQTLVASR